MNTRRAFLALFPTIAAAVGFTDYHPSHSAPPAVPAATGWQASGTLLESCTCAVPCTCNFAEGPSPHTYCHAVFGYRLDKASWDGVDLSGLIVAGADGPNGAAGFLDARASPLQRIALEKLARAIFVQGGPADGPRTFVPVALTHDVSGNHLRLQIAGRGGFVADVIVGRDGKSPIVVENNAVWPIARAVKAKSKPLDYKDSGGAGSIHGDGTNANYGAFSFAGRVGNAQGAASPASPKPAKALTGSCCTAARKSAG